GGIDDVLQPQRHAVQALAPPFAVHQAGAFERLVRVDIDPGLDDGIARCDALQACLGPLLAAQFARLHFAQPLLDRQRGDAGGGGPALGRLGHSTFFRHRNHSLGRKSLVHESWLEAADRPMYRSAISWFCNRAWAVSASTMRPESRM